MQQHSCVWNPGCLQRPISRLRIQRAPTFHASSRKLRVHQPRGCFRVKCSDASGASDASDEYRMAPVAPRTPFGELLTYYLKMEPLLFKSAVEDQLSILKEQKEAQEAKEKAAEAMSKAGDQSEVVLYERMEQMRRKEASATLEDLMYISVIEKFVDLGIDMMPRMEGFLDTHGDLSRLTDGVHSKEAIEVVKSHMYNMMGASSMAFSQATIKVSKLQMAQIYAASVMFGYFLRRVDSRFQLAKDFGMLPDDNDQATQTLEKLFHEASSMDSAEDVDSPSTSSGPSPGKKRSSGTGSTAKPALVKYMEQFDHGTLLEMTRIVSKEGSELIERQISALFGDINELQTQMQEALPDNIFAPEDLMKEVNIVVENDKVDTLTLTVGTHRRAVLEAVAFGAFLRDVETWVEGDYGILSPAPPPEFPPNSQMPPMSM